MGHFILAIILYGNVSIDIFSDVHINVFASHRNTCPRYRMSLSYEGFFLWLSESNIGEMCTLDFRDSFYL
jgi:hypothetical protein